jgi:hypothetical protein
MAGLTRIELGLLDEFVMAGTGYTDNLSNVGQNLLQNASICHSLPHFRPAQHTKIRTKESPYTRLG